jgi:hypothetical protein
MKKKLPKCFDPKTFFLLYADKMALNLAASKSKMLVQGACTVSRPNKILSYMHKKSA